MRCDSQGEWSAREKTMYSRALQTWKVNEIGLWFLASCLFPFLKIVATNASFQSAGIVPWWRVDWKSCEDSCELCATCTFSEETSRESIRSRNFVRFKSRRASPNLLGWCLVHQLLGKGLAETRKIRKILVCENRQKLLIQYVCLWSTVTKQGPILQERWNTCTVLAFILDVGPETLW